jgi:hypothetical protein
MQKSSVKKYSILGLVLLAASAVTAAIMPNKAEQNNFAGGSLTASQTSRITCAFTTLGVGAACTLSTAAGSVTTTEVESSASVSGLGGVGLGNTTT